MRKSAVLICILTLLIVILQFSWLSGTTNAEQQANCGNTYFEGDWFKVKIPDGMSVAPSETASNGEKVDSIWLLSQDGLIEFYVFAPQWGGTPYEIFVGAISRREIHRENTASGDIIQLELTYEDSIGQFEIAQSTDPVSHRTVGFRTETGELSPEKRLMFECFKNTINQFSD